VRNVYVIGIGAGDPEQLTLQAVRVLGGLDVVLVVDKGDAKRELTDLRHEICTRHIAGPYRVLTAADPARDRGAADYTGAVADWYDARADVLGALLRDEVSAGENVGILVWGDPALYDSTLRIMERVAASGLQLDWQVYPGISSVQVLAARHRIPLNSIGGPILVTTGRRLAVGFPADQDSVVVMLDGEQTFGVIDPEGLDIYWGAYLGTPDEILLAGPLATLSAEISRVRAEARARHGWIMDTYLLRRRMA
jgi:precorrin-6A synthase